MFKISHFLSIIACLIISSCQIKNENSLVGEVFIPQSNSPTNLKPIADSSKQILEVIRGIPDEIDGCGCLYSIDSLKYLSEEFVFCDNYENGILIFKQNRILMPFTSWTDEGSGKMIKYYGNDDLYIVLKSINIDSTDEEYTSKGDFYLYESKKLVFSTKIFGKCGC